MYLENGWTISSDKSNLDIKIFKNIQNENECLIRSKNDNDVLSSLIVSDTGIEIQEVSWTVTVHVDWINKEIWITPSYTTAPTETSTTVGLIYDDEGAGTL